MNLLGQLLKIRAGGPAAAGAARHLRHKAANPERLQYLLRGQYFFRAVAAGFGGQAHADGVSNAGQQQRRKAGGGGDQPLRAHAGFGQAQVQGVVAAGGQLRVHVDQVAHAADLGGEDDLVVAQAVALGGLGGVERAHHHGLHHHLAGGQRLRLAAVLVHHAGQQRLVERAPVDADADRLLVLDGAFDHHLEVVVVLLADRCIAGVDAVLGQRAGSGGELLEQQVAVVMEVAHDGHAQAAFIQALHDVRYGSRGVVVVDRDADDLRARQSQRRDLFDGTRNVRRVGVGHRLDDDRNLPADANLPDLDSSRLPSLNLRHASSLRGARLGGNYCEAGGSSHA